MNRNLLFASLLAMLSLAPSPARADSTLQPVPVPDTSKLAPEMMKALAEDRAEFDKVKANLVGPPLAQAYADLGAIYARSGFDEAAAIAFYDATQVVPSDGRWFYLRGVIARKLKRDDDARTNFQAALDRDKVYMPIRYRLADTLIDLGDLAGARNVLEETASAYPTQAVAFSMLGRLALRQKRYADAVIALNSALKLDPKANELYMHLAEAYEGQGNAAAAADARAKAGNVTPTLDDPLAVSISPRDATAAGEATLEQAQALAHQGRIAAARAKLAQILEKHPDDADALALSARINAATGNVAVARLEIDQALAARSGSGNATVKFTSGLVAEYAGDERTATDEYRQAQRLDGKLPDTWLMLGNAEMRHARYAEAAEQYRGLVKLLPGTAEAYAHLAAALVAQGRCGDALKEINQALAKRTNDGDVMQLFVRTASTCKDATPQERDIALDYGGVLYKQLPDAANSTAYALALAAHGKFKEAQEYQAEAIFEATRAGDAQGAAQYRATMQQFVKQQMPDRPWAADNAYFKAPMLKAPPPAPAPARTP